MSDTKILVTGANGQLGRVLTKALREQHGYDAVIASDLQINNDRSHPSDIFLDILNKDRLKETIDDFKITEVYHMAAILSASGEYNPQKTWNVNFNALLDLFETMRESTVKKLFFPSTIAVFGKTTPPRDTPQDVPLLPETVYGISKATGELWCNYYHKRYGLDVRSLRYPGIISYQSIPHGGTTDYAVEIYHEAIKEGKYECFLKSDTALPMMFINDAIRATIMLMDAPIDSVKTRYGYNLAAMTFTPAELADQIVKHIPEFQISYKPDFRQAIADSWSASIDDSRARSEWGWQPEYDLEKMTNVMIEKLKPKYL